MDEVDSSASEEGAGMISVFMATGARLIGMNLVGTVMTIGALMLESFKSFLRNFLIVQIKTLYPLLFAITTSSQ